MNNSLTEPQAFMVLNALPGIGPITLNRLLAEFGDDPRAVLAADARKLAGVQGVDQRPLQPLYPGRKTSICLARRSGLPARG